MLKLNTTTTANDAKQKQVQIQTIWYEWPILCSSIHSSDSTTSCLPHMHPCCHTHTHTLNSVRHVDAWFVFLHTLMYASKSIHMYSTLANDGPNNMRLIFTFCSKQTICLHTEQWIYILFEVMYAMIHSIHKQYVYNKVIRIQKQTLTPTRHASDEFQILFYVRWIFQYNQDFFSQMVYWFCYNFKTSCVAWHLLLSFPFYVHSMA